MPGKGADRRYHQKKFPSSHESLAPEEELHRWYEPLSVVIMGAVIISMLQVVLHSSVCLEVREKISAVENAHCEMLCLGWPTNPSSRWHASEV